MTEKSSAPEGEMPPLPEEINLGQTQGYNARMMVEYAREYAATSAAQAASGGAEPVAWIREEDLAKLRELGANADVALLAFKGMHFTIPLYIAAPDHPSPSREGPSDAAQAKDAARYVWLRAGNYPLEFARSVLNDTPHGIDAAIDAAMKEHQP